MASHRPPGPSDRRTRDQSGGIHPLDEAAYQNRLATLLIGRACDPGADAHELQGLATRVLWDKDETKEVTTFHKKVALSLLRASDVVGLQGGGPEEARRRSPARRQPRCHRACATVCAAC